MAVTRLGPGAYPIAALAGSASVFLLSPRFSVVSSEDRSMTITEDRTTALGPQRRSTIVPRGPARDNHS